MNGFDEFIEAVEDGNYDVIIGELVPRLKAAVNSRKEALLVEGARVRFNDTVSPRYLVGVAGTVKSVTRNPRAKKRRIEVRVELDGGGYGRFGEVVKAFPDILDIVEAAPQTAARSVQS